MKPWTKRPKYRANPVILATGERFDSTAEYKRHLELQALADTGAILYLRRQPRFPLVVASVKIATYVADWEYVENDRRVAEDRKGFETPVFKLKWKLVKALYPEWEFRLS